ncbi:MAG: hypothetical protein AB7K86_09895 [Rhodospirillales bacterium]
MGVPVRLQIALLVFPMACAVNAGVALAATLSAAPAVLHDPVVLAFIATLAFPGGAAAAWGVAGRLVRPPPRRPALRLIEGGKSHLPVGVVERRPAGGVGALHSRPSKGWTP